MCGIVSAFGDFRDPEITMFKTLLFLDTVRGPHSTGVATIDVSGNTKILKKAVDGAEFLKLPEFDKTISVSHVGLIGHNRWATQGAVTDANAHPFEHDHIVGVHNGSLDYSYKDHLFEEIKRPEKDFDVDSENFFYALSKGDTEDVLERTHGAFAFVWYDKDQHRIYFIRNDKRPLCYGFTKDRKVFYLLSDPKMFLTARENIRGGSFELEGSGLMNLTKEGVLYGLDLPQGFNKAFKDFAVRRTINCSSKRKKYSYNYGPYSSGRHEVYDGYSVIHGERQSKYTPPPSNPNKLNPDALVERSKKIWRDYTIGCTAKKNNEKFLRALQNSVNHMTAKDALREISNLERTFRELNDLWDQPTIGDTKEYYPETTRDICSKLGRADWYMERLSCYFKTAPKKAIKKVLKDAKTIQGFDEETFFKQIESIDYLDFSILESKPSPIIEALEEEEKKLLFLDSPSGCANLSLFDFKKIIKEQGCSVCSAQDIGWEGSECGLTTEKELICPECMNDALTHSYISQGVIKLVS